MRFEVLLDIGCLAYCLILMSVYMHKQTFKFVRNRTYTGLLVLVNIFTISEIAVYYLLYNLGSTTLVTILWKAHFVLGLLCSLLFYYYFSSLLNNKEEKDFKTYLLSNKLNIVVTIIYVLSMIAYLILPIGKFNIDKMNFIPKYTIYIFLLVSLINCIFIIMFTMKTKTELTKKKKLFIIISVLIPIVFVVVQVLVKYVSLLPIGLIFELYCIYYYIENPDLELLEEITSAQGDIEQSNQTKTDFLSNMTSEIKVPMNLIVSLCDELKTMPVFNEKLIREDISQIYTSGTSLLDIVNNILDISKIETGKSILQEKDYRINNLLTDVINIAKSKIGAKQVKLMVNVDQNISSVLNGDYSKLYQALTNIVTNSAKYTDVGKITFTLTSTKSGGNEVLLFKINDTGSGIKEEDQALLFQKGTRLSNATQSEIEGSGLGLAITKEYVELLGGKIWFDSQYRVGSTFYIEVPQKIVDSTPIGAAKEKQQTAEKLDCSKFTVLIVDDNNLNIKVAKRLLETYKFKVESVTSGKDCVYKVKEGIHYDAIFMDHMMPEMDGIETLHVLKKLTGYELPPIIALTANAVAGMREMYLNEGFDEYLSKPINTNDLDRIVNLFFNK